MNECLDRIKKGEGKLQLFCQSDIDELKVVMNQKKEIANELNLVRIRVSQQCEDFDRIKNKEDTANRAIESQIQAMNDNKPLENIKQALANLKDQIKSMNYQIALGRYQIDQFSAKS